MKRHRCKPHQEKPLRQKMLEAAVIIYAGFAICVMGAFAECVATPLAAKIRRRRKAKDAGT